QLLPHVAAPWLAAQAARDEPAMADDDPYRRIWSRLPAQDLQGRLHPGPGLGLGHQRKAALAVVSRADDDDAPLPEPGRVADLRVKVLDVDGPAADLEAVADPPHDEEFAVHHEPGISGAQFAVDEPAGPDG